MPVLTTPFPYRDYLIGEEIMYRALIQQETFAGEGNSFGAQWNDATDGLIKSGTYFKASLLRTDFTIPSEYQHCMPYPPCPWRKDDDILSEENFKPIIMGAGGVYTYSFDVYKRRDDGTRTFTVEDHLMSYTIDESQLSPAIRSEFTYYTRHVRDSAPGARAVIVIQRSHRGSVDLRFYYLFTFA